jgi:methyltransferase (TIGR00027 family)
VADRLSRTAQNIAVARAVLDHFEGPVEDPYAKSMLRAPWRGIARLLCSSAAEWAGSSRLFGYLAARTLFYDDVVATAIRDGATQVVVIGAGSDTRALRLGSPGVTFYEVDRPRTQRDKERRLAAAGRTTPVLVPADLEIDDLGARLADAGFDATESTVFVCEGVTMYLTQHAVHRLLSTLSDLTTGTATLGIDLALDESQSRTATRRPPAWLVTTTDWLTTAALGEPLRLRVLSTEVEPLLRGHHWHCAEILDPHNVCDRYLQGTDLRRPPPGEWLNLAHCVRR